MLVYNHLAVGVLHQVALHGDYLRAARLDVSGRLLYILLFFWEIGDGDTTSAFDGKHESSRTPKAGVAAGDERRLALQPREAQPVMKTD
jgi:hypothetical protein